MPYPAVQSPSPPYPRQPSTTTSSSSSSSLNKKRSTRMNSRKNQRPIPDGLNVPSTYDNAQLPLQFASMVAGGSPNVSPFSTELDPTVSAAAKVLFSPQGNFVQELILEEAVNIADALSRSIVTTAISSLTKNPITVGSVILRNALVGGTAAILPPMLKPVSTTLRKMKPFFPFSLAVQELEGVFHLRDEDIESLRILKRLVQLLAGVDPSLPQANKHHIMDPTGQQTFVGTTMDGKVATTSSGLIDADDLALVQQVLLQFSSQLKPGQWPTQALTLLGSEFSQGQGKEGENPGPGTELEVLRTQMRQILPLIRDSVPGATTLAIRFGRKLMGRSLGRLAERIEGVNQQYEDDLKNNQDNNQQRPTKK